MIHNEMPTDGQFVVVYITIEDKIFSDTFKWLNGDLLIYTDDDDWALPEYNVHEHLNIVRDVIYITN